MADAPVLAPGARADLVEVLGPRGVVTDADLTATHTADWTGRYRGTTAAVLRPTDAAQVAATVAICRRHGLAIVPQGGLTGLVGGSVPHHGEVVLSLRALDHVGEVSLRSMQVTVGAGTTLSAVQAAARPHGLTLGVDLAARDSATIGGMVATNAGGLHVIRHGPMRHQLVGHEAVLGTGATVSHLGGLVKDNTGYDLGGLLCGSEGTLGVLTTIRVALVPLEPHRVVALCAFAQATDAVDAAAMWRRELPGLSAAELVGDAGVELVRRVHGDPSPFAQRHPWYVLVEVVGGADPTDALAATVAATPGVVDAAVATDPRRQAALWDLREGHTTAINTLGAPHKLDVTLPLDGLAAFVDAIPAVVAAVAPGASTWLFGHVADGNVHVNVTGVAADDDRVDDAVLRHVAAHGGAISAEHGIGVAKRRWLDLARSPAELSAFRAIKQALDPDGILNPHVLL